MAGKSGVTTPDFASYLGYRGTTSHIAKLNRAQTENSTALKYGQLLANSAALKYNLIGAQTKALVFSNWLVLKLSGGPLRPKR